ncbi:winged helix-turn-helix domain-containing protein [Novosphingobium sp. ERN07]|uniref:winged helix-turn-helix domain-containing protein n=1 Tax=Novosphingobium sp. ERN07 TaxID=2726187 RepID=UPI000F7F7791|nr:winged helix-turn-helix domain-containing protein [Novosphingobium sp. ERW19]NLR70784.1 winged helix-turn-helix domain-containing protein [Novosphingobium sp. ERN07]
MTPPSSAITDPEPNPNRPLSRSYLLERVWGTGVDVHSRTLDTHIARLRRKLDLGETVGVTIRTLYGFGYQLEAVIDHPM